MALKAEVAIQYINTNELHWLGWSALKSQRSDLRRTPLVRQCITMAPQRKPVIVRKFSRDWVAGYASASFTAGQQALDLLDTGGKVLFLDWDAVKWICYVRDIAQGGDQPERLLQRRFAVRPRTPGLWLRLTLRDNDELEGLAAADVSLIEGVGLMLTPPDTRSNTQRIFVPRPAIVRLEVAGLIGSAKPRRGPLAAQPDLFPGETT